MARLKHMAAFVAMATLGAALALPMAASAAMPDGVSDKLLLYTNIHAGAINISPTGMKEMDFLRKVTHARTTAPPGLGHIMVSQGPHDEGIVTSQKLGLRDAIGAKDPPLPANFTMLDRSNLSANMEPVVHTIITAGHVRPEGGGDKHKTIEPTETT